MGSNKRNRPVAVITGANAGLGYGIAEQLVVQYSNIRLCLACRNKSKAQEAADSISQFATDAEISIVVLDTSSLKSVKEAAEEIKEKYDHIDYIYLNAGMMKVTGFNWSYILGNLFSSRIFHMFTTGEGVLIHEDWITKDGLQNVFQTNTFGHYVLVKELSERLGSTADNANGHSQLIWTSSSNAKSGNFNINDIQCKSGKDPYSSSKFAMDIASVGLNNRMNEQGVYSHTVCPGLVVTNLTHGILSPLIWTIILPIIWLVRIFVSNWTYSVSIATHTLIWLSHQNPVGLDPLVKFQSLCTVSGQCKVGQEKMKIDPDEAELFLTKLDELDLSFHTSVR